MKEWPRISIVTPSLNQGDFIETTIRSILSQGYPNLEYIIMDGGSSDGTLALLEKYSGQVQWSSEKDEGQTDAINKGLRQASGEILCYVNADDILLPGSLAAVAEAFEGHPEIKWLTGKCQIIDGQGQQVRSAIYLYKNMLLQFASYRLLLLTNFVSQPATFWRKDLSNQCGGFDPDLQYVMDYDYWLRLWKVSPPYFYKRDLAAFRIQHNSKTTSSGHLQAYIREESQVIARHAPGGLWRRLHAAHRFLMTSTYRVMNR